MPIHTAHIGLGSNLGDRLGAIDKALAEIARLRGTRVLRRSRLIDTQPVGGPEQGNFLNGAALIETMLEPIELLTEVKSIERLLGRRPGARWGPRTIDIDILTFNDRVIKSGELTIPHPQLPVRRFVLEPLAEIDPGYRHPELNKTVAELLSGLT